MHFAGLSVLTAGCFLLSGSIVGAQSPAVYDARIQQLENDLRTLTGKIEEQNFKIQQMQQQLERFSSDVTLRLNDLEQGRGGSAAGASPVGSSVVGRASQYMVRGNDGALTAVQTPDPVIAGDNSGYKWSSGGPGVEVNSSVVSSTAPATPDALYETAYTLVKNNQYEEAAKAFQSFLDANPDHALAGNAKYWLGETYYVRNDYQTAARVFAEAYQQYPKSGKAADNLLKLGMSLAGLGKKDDACIALGQLKKEYATTAAPVVRRAEQEMSNLGC